MISSTQSIDCIDRKRKMKEERDTLLRSKSFRRDSDRPMLVRFSKSTSDIASCHNNIENCDEICGTSDTLGTESTQQPMHLIATTSRTAMSDTEVQIEADDSSESSTSYASTAGEEFHHDEHHVSNDCCMKSYDANTVNAQASHFNTTSPLGPSQTQATKQEPQIDISTLDPRNSRNTCVPDLSPDAYVLKLFQAVLGFQLVTRPTLEASSLTYNSTQDPFIKPISEEQLANYDVDVVAACRENDLEELRLLHGTGRSLSCCNRYGESLLHMACRRGFFPIVSFLVHGTGAAIRITDDCGRTPLHDALWHRDCQYSVVDLLIQLDPSLLLLCDKHGHTPFSYARREHWEVWKQFLWDRREHILQAVDVEVMELFKST